MVVSLITIGELLAWNAAFSGGDPSEEGVSSAESLSPREDSPNEEPVALNEHFVGVKSVAFSHDGDLLTYGDGDGNVLLQDIN